MEACPTRPNVHVLSTNPEFTVTVSSTVKEKSNTGGNSRLKNRHEICKPQRAGMYVLQSGETPFHSSMSSCSCFLGHCAFGRVCMGLDCKSTETFYHIQLWGTEPQNTQRKEIKYFNCIHFSSFMYSILIVSPEILKMFNFSKHDHIFSIWLGTYLKGI